MQKIPELEIIRSYRNTRVIQKFQRDFPSLQTQADSLFEELMKYLWLSQRQRIDRMECPEREDLKFLLAIYDEMINIDHLWHCFILCTEEYETFCSRFYGRFLHHVPDALDALPPTREELARDLEKYVSYVYDHLGADTVKNWFGVVSSEE